MLPRDPAACASYHHAEGVLVFRAAKNLDLGGRIASSSNFSQMIHNLAAANMNEDLRHSVVALAPRLACVPRQNKWFLSEKY
jgi:hypothetical protein